ncbi:IclR family transcriptional regulator [Pseudofrankia sp. DC12]|uniref:IclR family transcriptional regulator n=1 Tax=Pseudofrankia sp. DC12 TaxID=683315 RepID=UPI0005F88336|nr:IclR family transcriptional regulator [Pseudofrankia sp. DC12]
MEQRNPSPGLDAAGASSGVGVLDKAALVLAAVEEGPVSLGELVARTRLSRATAHRLAVALETHRLVARDSAGRFVAGPRLAAGSAVAALWPLPWRLLQAAPEVLAELRDSTGESTQLYVRRGAQRVCVAASEHDSGLRDTVPVGAILPMTAGSGAQVLLAFAAPDETAPGGRAGAGMPGQSGVRPPAERAFDEDVLAQVRARGWAQSAGEREAGLASVSAPVRDAAGCVVAALSMSGPDGRLTRSPGELFGVTVATAADRLSAIAGYAATNNPRATERVTGGTSATPGTTPDGLSADAKA